MKKIIETTKKQNKTILPVTFTFSLKQGETKKKKKKKNSEPTALPLRTRTMTKLAPCKQKDPSLAGSELSPVSDKLISGPHFCLVYSSRTAVDKDKGGLTVMPRRSCRDPAETLTDHNIADDI